MGRADLAIIRGGFKVHPDDVNATYEQHPAIREAVTVGMDDRRLGAVPMMAIMLKDGANAPSDGELKDYGKAHLMPYQVPVKFLIVDDVPRTPSMKPAPSLPLPVRTCHWRQRKRNARKSSSRTARCQSASMTSV